jgi:hypothetical protein
MRKLLYAAAMLCVFTFVVLDFCIAVDLNAPAVKKVTIKTEIQRGFSEGSYVAKDQINTLYIASSIFDTLSINKKKNTDTDPFKLGLFFYGWFKMSLIVKDPGSDNTADDFFSIFRENQNKLKIDDKTLLEVCGLKYDAVKPKMDDWGKKVK